MAERAATAAELALLDAPEREATPEEKALLAPDFLRERGNLDADGNYTVETPQGPARFTPDGTRIDSPEEAQQQVDLSRARDKEALLSRVLATTAGAAQGFAPQIAGIGAALHQVDRGLPQFAGQDYRKARDAAAKTISAADETAGPGYGIAGSVATTLLAPESVPARIGLTTAISAANSAARSKGDLTQLDQPGNASQFAGDTALGAGVGLVAGGVGEGLTAGLRAGAGYLEGRAAAAVTRRTAADVAAVEGEVASLRGKLGSETQQGSRILENAQRAVTGAGPAGDRVGAVGEQLAGEAEQALQSPESQRLAEKVLARNLAELPGKQASIERLETELAAKQAGAAGEAAKRTADYFKASLASVEGRNIVRTLAPRFGLAALGAASGAAYDAVAGNQSHSAGFTGAVLGAPGMLMMLRNLNKSPRVAVAIAQHVAPLLGLAANALGASVAPSAAAANAVLSEKALGDHDLAAEKLTARGTLGSLLGDQKPAGQEPTPETEMDRAIQQTVAVVGLAGALEDHNRELERGIGAVFSGQRAPHSAAEATAGSQDFGTKRMRREQRDAHQRHLDDVSQLAADPSAMLDRVASNTGSLANVAPGVAGALARTADRAVKYLAQAGAKPPKAGPLAPEWHATEDEIHAYNVKSEVVHEPMAVLKHAAAGTLVPDQLDALRTVYPTLARQITDMALSKLTAAPKGISYRSRLMLSMLTGVDVDGTTSPEAIARNQAAIHARAQQEQAAPAAQGGRSTQMTLAARTALPGQQRDTEAA